MKSARIKKIDLSAHSYADKQSYRPHHSEWLKALLDYKEGYIQAVEDFKISTTDELGNCHGTSMNRIEYLEHQLKSEKQAVERLRKVILKLKEK